MRPRQLGTDDGQLATSFHPAKARVKSGEMIVEVDKSVTLKHSDMLSITGEHLALESLDILRLGAEVVERDAKTR